MRRGFYILLAAAVVACALFFRLHDLGGRPLHHDEANQAVRCGLLLDDGTYRYDPSDHHGPSLYYLALPVLHAVGEHRFVETEVWAYRLLPVLAGVLLVLLTFAVSDGLGRGGALLAALFCACSPGLVYYSRFFIQEILLVAFAFGAIVAGWRYWRRPDMGWAVACGACLGLCFATKETCIILWAGMGAGLVCSGVWRRHGEFRLRDVAGGVLSMVVVSILLYSSFGSHWTGVVDAVSAYGGYVNKGVGDVGAHLHPWYSYLRWLVWPAIGPGPVWTEAVIVLLALVGAVAAWVVRDSGARLSRALSMYVLVMVLVFSLIPYKTPWNGLPMLHGMVLLAGYGGWWLLSLRRNTWWRVVWGTALAACVVHLGLQAWRGTHRFSTDIRNPYVYAHTSRDFLKMMDRVEDVAAVSSEGRNLLVAVVAPPSESWPHPFYLRRFPRVGYWSDATEVPESLSPAVWIVSTDQEAVLTDRLDGYKPSYFGLRPEVLQVLYIRDDLWDTFIETRQ